MVYFGRHPRTAADPHRRAMDQKLQSQRDQIRQSCEPACAACAYGETKPQRDRQMLSTTWHQYSPSPPEPTTRRSIPLPTTAACFRQRRAPRRTTTKERLNEKYSAEPVGGLSLVRGRLSEFSILMPALTTNPKDTSIFPSVAHLAFECRLVSFITQI